MEKSKCSRLVGWSFFTLSIALLVMVGLGISKGVNFLMDYYWLFIILFICWWISLFLKLKSDNNKRKDSVKNYGDRIRKRIR